MRAVPDVGSITPVSIEIVWVLPAPLGPSRPKTSPSSTEKLMPLTASKSPYFLTSTPSSRIAGMGTTPFFIDRHALGATCGVVAAQSSHRSVRGPPPHLHRGWRHPSG